MTTKADKNAAERVLTAAVRKARTMSRTDSRAAVVNMLTAACVAADVLLDES